jgi:hypothetical protein
MGLAENIAYVDSLLEAYDHNHPACGVISLNCDEVGVPFDMRGGSLGADWVSCLMLPSTLTATDVDEVERAFGVVFPPIFRAYLLAKFHLHGEVYSQRHTVSVTLPELPSRDPLDKLLGIMQANAVLIDAGYIPFGSWNGGAGPLCFDAPRRAEDGDCPVVWMDHERLAHLGAERCRTRANVEPLASVVYGSFRELLPDVFVR